MQDGFFKHCAKYVSSFAMLILLGWQVRGASFRSKRRANIEGFPLCNNSTSEGNFCLDCLNCKVPL